MTERRFCSQCYGRGWVRIQGHRVTCTCRLFAPAPDDQKEQRDLARVR